MARVIYAYPVSELVGSVGGVTFQRNSSGKTARSKPNMVVNPSPAQAGQQYFLSQLVALWPTLTVAEKTSWTTNLVPHLHVTPWGESKYLNGYQWFMSSNLNLLQAGEATIKTSPAWAVIAQTDAFTLVANSTNLYAQFSGAYSPSPNYIFVYLTVPLRQSSLKLRRSLFIVCVDKLFNASNAWVEKAPQYGAEAYVLALAIFNDKLYGSTSPNGNLFEWNGSNAWIQKAPILGVETSLYSLVVYNNKLYSGTNINGKLYEWNGTNAWVEKAPKYSSETYIPSLAVFNYKLYGSTSPNGNLFEWNGTNAWVQKAPQLGVETLIYSLTVFNNKLYGGTNVNGNLYEWNGTNAWVAKAPKLGAETMIYSLVVYNNKLYGGTGSLAKLYEWNGTNAWVEKAPQLGAETIIISLVVFNNKLYGSTFPSGKLYQWNDSNAWVEVAPQLGTESQARSLTIFNNKLYAGTAGLGKLYKYQGLNYDLTALFESLVNVTWADFFTSTDSNIICRLLVVKAGAGLASPFTSSIVKVS